MRVLVDEALAAGPERAAEVGERVRRLVEAGAEPIGDRFALSPALLSRAEGSAMDRFAAALHVVLNEAVRAIRRDARLRRRLTLGLAGLSAVARRYDLGHVAFAATWPASLRVARHPSPAPILRARADGFLIAGRLRVVEINVGAMVCDAVDALGGLLSELAPAALVGATPARCAGALADALLDRGTRPRRQERAVVGLLHHPAAPSSDERGLRRALEASGAEVIGVGPGDLRVARGVATVAGRAVGAIVEESTAEPAPLSRFGARARVAYKLARTRALRSGAALVHPAPYEGLFSKAFLALVSDGGLEGHVDPSALDVVAGHVAWTRRTVPGQVRSPGGGPADLRALALADRAELVLKPVIGYAAAGVVFGDEVDPDAWRRAVDGALRRGDHVLQERVRPERVEVLTADRRRVPALVDACPVCVDGRVAAVYSRFATEGARLHLLGGAERSGSHGLIAVLREVG